MLLRKLAWNCEFGDINKEIKIQLVEKCTSTRVRRKALREEISLEDLLKYGRTLETTDRQISQFESPHQSGIQANNLDAPKSCSFCGGDFSHPQGRASCPASRKTCGHRGKLGHFAQVCKMKSGTSRNLSKSRMSRQTTSSEGARYKSWNSVNAVDSPDSSVHQIHSHVYRLVTAMTTNSSLPWRGQQQHHPSNSQLPRSQ